MSHIVMIHQSYGIIRVQPPPSWCSCAAATIVRLTGAHRVLIGPRAPASSLPRILRGLYQSVPTNRAVIARIGGGGLVLAAYSFALICY